MNARVFFVLLVAALAMSLTAVSCEPLAPLKVENKTDQTLTVFAAYTRYEHVNPTAERALLGSVEPGKVLEPENFPADSEAYLIEAKNPQGNVVYSKEFTVKELREASWKVVISTNK